MKIIGTDFRKVPRSVLGLGLYRYFYIFTPVKSIYVYFLLLSLTVMSYLSIVQVALVSADLTSVHSSVHRDLDRSESLSVITVTTDDFASGYARYTDEDEISVNGKLYDITNRQIQGENVRLTISHDEKEEGLIADLKSIFDSWFGTQSGDSSKQPFAKQLDIFKDFIPSGKFCFCFDTNKKRLATPDLFLVIESPDLLILKSPPQLV